MTVPKMLRKKFFSAYSKHYQVHVEDMIEPFESYRTFSAFFTRRVKPRSILQ